MNKRRKVDPNTHNIIELATQLATFYNFQKVTVRKGYRSLLGLDEFQTSSDVPLLDANN